MLSRVRIYRAVQANVFAGWEAAHWPRVRPAAADRKILARDAPGVSITVRPKSNWKPSISVYGSRYATTDSWRRGRPETIKAPSDAEPAGSHR
ncbi:unnamed protein product, partial [Iphiclides podalirius]